jgi:hypothetical protein
MKRQNDSRDHSPLCSGSEFSGSMTDSASTGYEYHGGGHAGQMYERAIMTCMGQHLVFDSLFPNDMHRRLTYHFERVSIEFAAGLCQICRMWKLICGFSERRASMRAYIAASTSPMSQIDRETHEAAHHVGAGLWYLHVPDCPE